MAIHKNLLVNGSSRFLNKAYFQDVQIDGTATLSSLSLSGTLTVSGTTTLNGATTLKGATTINNTLNVTGTTTLKSMRADNGIELYHNTPYIDFHFGNSTTDYTSRIIESSSGTLSIENNLSIASTISAPTGVISTLNSTNVNVTNNLRANHYDLQTVAQLGGSFYVSPTVKFPNSGTSLTVAKSGTTLTLTITDSSITSTTMAGVVWTANSGVKVSGTINGVVTGTMDGTVSSINTSSHVLTLSVSGENSGSVTAGTYSASQFSDLSVMVYQRRDGSNDYRVGIWMNCYDVANSSSTIRIYGGSDANPNVMLGNLTSAGLGTVNNLTPTGWGLFAQNAFLHGKVVANGGLIGNWTIGQTGMYYDSDAPGSTSITMIPGGTTASTTSIGGSSGSKSWIFTGKNLFGIDTDGKLYASSAVISGDITANTGYIGGTSGWTITSQQLSSGTIGQNNSLFLATKDLTSNTPIGARPASEGTDWRFTIGSQFGVTNTGVLYANSVHISGTIFATSGTIGGVTANSGYGLYTNGKSSATSTKEGFLISKDGAIYLGAYNSTNGACPFQVTSDGALTATSGKIGGWNIGASAIYSGTHSAYNSANDGIYIGQDYIAMGSGGVTYFNTSGTGKIGPWTLSSTYFRNGDIASATNTSVAGVYLGTDGLNISNGTAATTAYITKTAVNIGNKLTWNGTTLSVNGKITAASGTIGGITANSSYGLYTNSKTTATSTKTGFLISKSGAIYLGAYNSTNGSCPFQVTSDGILTATGANISGTLTAGANSQIGPWTVSDESIYKVSSTFGDPTSGAAYFGDKGLSIGGLVKIDADNTTIQLGGAESSRIDITNDKLTMYNNVPEKCFEIGASTSTVPKYTQHHIAGENASWQRSTDLVPPTNLEADCSITFQNAVKIAVDYSVTPLDVDETTQDMTGRAIFDLYPEDPDTVYSQTFMFGDLLATMELYYSSLDQCVVGSLFGPALDAEKIQSFGFMPACCYTTEDIAAPTFSFGSILDDNTIGGYGVGIGWQVWPRNKYSLSTGSFTQTSADYQAVFGKYNNPNKNDILQVGNGSSDGGLSNALELTFDGALKVANPYKTLKNLGIQCGQVSITVAANTGATSDVVFDEAFTNKPIVVCSIESGAGPVWVSKMTAGCYSVQGTETTETHIRVWNSDTASRTVAVNWIAIDFGVINGNQS